MSQHEPVKIEVKDLPTQVALPPEAMQELAGGYHLEVDLDWATPTTDPTTDIPIKRAKLRE